MSKYTFIHRLQLSWSISRGRDTYGYNICRLDAIKTWPQVGRRYRCMGGGYDMIGTVFGEYLADTFQDRLKHVTPSRLWNSESKKHIGIAESVDGKQYGLTHYIDDSGRFVKAVVDGACGIETMTRLAERMGLEVQKIYSKRGDLDYILVSELEEEVCHA